jgi:hypothetical protein
LTDIPTVAHKREGAYIWLSSATSPPLALVTFSTRKLGLKELGVDRVGRGTRNKALGDIATDHHVANTMAVED